MDKLDKLSAMRSKIGAVNIPVLNKRVARES